MRKKQNLLFLIGLSFALITIYLFLNPKLSSYINPYKRKTLWNNFLNQTLENKKINSRSFWEFREFYYPGNIIFESKGLLREEIDKKLRKNFSFSLQKDKYFYPFMIFQSDKITSIETLVKVKKINEILVNSTNVYYKMIFQDDSTLIYSSTNNNIIVIFIKPIEDMIKTNGYFDYKKNDKELLKDKYWLVISKINLD